MNNPLVSIIVRTKDRPKLLKRALQSISAQTYRPIEVVLVNDGGCGLDVEGLKNTLGDISLNYIKLEKNMGRAHAGNIGIGNAKGKYIGFLDDDDEFYPEHVSLLASYLEQSDLKVAYSDSIMVYEEYGPQTNEIKKAKEELVYSQDFDYDILVLENYIPFMCLLFDRDALASSAGLDSTLEIYEDWDLLIRIGDKYPFHHIKKVTANYNQWSMELQISQRNKDQDFLKKSYLKVLSKHFKEITPNRIHACVYGYAHTRHLLKELRSEFEKYKIQVSAGELHKSNLEDILRQRDVHIGNLEDILRQRDAHISNLEGLAGEKDARIREAETIVNEKEAYIQHIQSGHGWKLLSRDYRVRDRLLPAGTMRRTIVRILFNLPFLFTTENLRKSLSYLKKSDFKAFLAKLKKKVGLETHPVIRNDIELDEAFRLWIKKNKPGHRELEKQRKTKFPYEPKISIIVPAYNTPKELLINMIESVLNQSYSNWELCIADGGSGEPHVKKILKKYMLKDSRIKISFLKDNTGIAGNSNEAISRATGDYIAFLDHDDALSLSALFEVVKKINENSGADFLYSDFAITGEDGKVQNISFCPDFCRYYYLSYPYIVHLVVIKKELIDKVGAFDVENFSAGVSQDVDLYLRIFAQLEDNNILHIPKVLYFWKHSTGSSGHKQKEKVPAYTNKAIQRYLELKGLDGWVENGLFFNSFRIRFRIQDKPFISIIIPTKNKWQFLDKCLKSIELNAGYDNYEILIVKNNTDDKNALQYLDSLNGKYNVIEYPMPFNYSAINNFAASMAKGDVLLFLNDDVEFKGRDILVAALELLQLKEIGIVGAKLLYPNDKIQHSGVIIGLWGIAEHWHKFEDAYLQGDIPNPGYISSLVSIREYSAVTGAFLMTKRNVFDEVGGFSEDFAIGLNDIDYCLKVLAKGYKVLFSPYVTAYHHEHVSRIEYKIEDPNIFYHPDDSRRFLEKWGPIIDKGDACFNPNLDINNFSPYPKL